MTTAEADQATYKRPTLDQVLPTRPHLDCQQVVSKESHGRNTEVEYNPYILSVAIVTPVLNTPLTLPKPPSNLNHFFLPNHLLVRQSYSHIPPTNRHRPHHLLQPTHFRRNPVHRGFHLGQRTARTTRRPILGCSLAQQYHRPKPLHPDWRQPLTQLRLQAQREPQSTRAVLDAIRVRAASRARDPHHQARHIPGEDFPLLSQAEGGRSASWREVS